jgi:hypothetical protein
VATEQQIIDKVRRRVADYTEDRKYDDVWYQDAIEHGIQKLNFDFDETYATVPDVPSNRTFLLVKLATIEMCWMRGSEGAVGDSDIENVDTQFTSVAVPDLSVTDNNAESSRGPSYWMKLADKLQAEYDEEVGSKAGQNTGGLVEVGITRKISLTHGGFIKRKLDPGLPAVTITATVDGSDVLIEWSLLQREDFLHYEVVRDSDPTFKTEVVIKQEQDIHVTEYTDEDVNAGTWYYRVKTVNPNLLKTDSSSAIAVVT